MSLWSAWRDLSRRQVSALPPLLQRSSSPGPSGLDDSTLPGRPAFLASVPLGRTLVSRGNDLRVGDYAAHPGQDAVWPAHWSGNRWLPPVLAGLSSAPDATLRDRVRQELASCGAAEPELSILMDHFARRSGKTFVSVRDSDWAQALAATSQARGLMAVLHDRVQETARHQLKTRGLVELDTLPMTLHESDRLMLPQPRWGIAFGILGRSSGLGLAMQQLHHDRSAGTITGVLSLRLLDVFGVSDVDNDTEGQMALWVLQHQRGYPAFLHEVVLEAPLKVSVVTPSMYGPVRRWRRGA